MTKGTRYTPEFKAKAVRLLTESRGSYSSETKAIEQVAKDLGVAPETLRRWRNKTDATVAAETKQSAEDAMAELKSLRAEVARLRRANEILTTASAFSRHGSTRHGVDGRLHRRIQGPFSGSGRSAGCWPLRWTAGSSRRAATACSDPGPSAAWPPGTRRWPATSSRSMPIPSWPCTGTARRTPSCWRGAGIRPRSAATR